MIAGFRITALIAAVVFAGSVMAQSAPVKKTGSMLTNNAGMTLYTFDRDSGGKSACNGPCATNWPPLAAGADAKASGEFSVVARDDGSKQWAYKGKPLYTWSKDTKPGEATGDGFNGAWHVAKD